MLNVGELNEGFVLDHIEAGKIMLNQKAQDNKKTYTVAEIADMLGIGRTSAYNLVKENHFKVVKIGASIRISKKSFDDWLDKLNI